MIKKYLKYKMKYLTLKSKSESISGVGYEIREHHFSLEKLEGKL